MSRHFGKSKTSTWKRNTKSMPRLSTDEMRDPTYLLCLSVLPEITAGAASTPRIAKRQLTGIPRATFHQRRNRSCFERMTLQISHLSKKEQTTRACSSLTPSSLMGIRGERPGLLGMCPPIGYGICVQLGVFNNAHVSGKITECFTVFVERIHHDASGSIIMI